MLSLAWTRRAKRTALITSAILVLATFWTIFRHETTRNHLLLVDSLTPFQNGPKNKAAWVKLKEPDKDVKRSICHTNGFSTHPRPRKVYDLVLLSTELDWLEIRLHTLAPYVDYFVVVESPTTFTGRPKPLWLQDNWERFREFHHKIIHRVVEDGSPSRFIWDHEDWLRNSLLREVFPGLDRHERAEYGDVLVISDVDEIVRPEAMFVLRHCEFPPRLTLRSDFYYYSFQWRHRGPQWAHPEATVYRGSETLLPNTLRQGLLDEGWAPLASFRRWRDRGTLLNAGWHCSSCFATVAEMQTKLHSFSHQELDTPENSDARVMMGRVREGKDLFGREDQVYEKVEAGDMDVPSYIVERNKLDGRFRYLLDRDGEDAGFEDWESAA